MNLMLVALIPRLMGLTDKVMAIVNGTAKPGDYKEVLSELYELMKAVPQLQGLLLLAEPLVKIVRHVGEELFSDPSKANLYGLTEEDVRKGQAIVELLGPALEAMQKELLVAAAAVQPGDVPKLTGTLK